jgi:hypothetical protein
MYHPMLTFAVAQTRIDDLTNDVRRGRLTGFPTRPYPPRAPSL